MQLSSLLRPEKVKKRWKEQRYSYEEDLFKIYEGLDGEFQLESRMQACFDNGVDGQKLARKVVDQLLNYGWAIDDSYPVGGHMIIELEV